MSPICHHKRDLRTSADLSREDIEAILEQAEALKDAQQRGNARPILAGKSLAMIFEKPSLRTRCTFEIGMVQLGGHAIYLTPQEIGLGRRESIHDVARNLERWFDLVLARTYAQATVDELALHCHVPVINALSELEHPCQALADMMTLREKVGDLEGFTLTYIGDGNNICHSLMQIGVKLGMKITVSSPAGYEPFQGIVDLTREAAGQYGGSYRFERDPRAAVAGAQAIYTDVWASMGQENEAAQRSGVFEPYQVNGALVAAAPAGALIMHDLPAHRGEEITAEVIDDESSIVFDQAENRLHAQKGIMVFLDQATR